MRLYAKIAQIDLVSDALMHKDEASWLRLYFCGQVRAGTLCVHNLNIMGVKCAAQVVQLCVKLAVQILLIFP